MQVKLETERNMKIKNKKFFLNLNDGEKIVYTTEKNNFNFWWNFIFLVVINSPIISFC